MAARLVWVTHPETKARVQASERQFAVMRKSGWEMDENQEPDAPPGPVAHPPFVKGLTDAPAAHPDPAPSPPDDVVQPADPAPSPPDDVVQPADGQGAAPSATNDQHLDSEES